MLLHFLMKYYRYQAISLTSKPSVALPLVIWGHSAAHKSDSQFTVHSQLSKAYRTTVQSISELCLNNGFIDIWAHLKIQSL